MLNLSKQMWQEIMSSSESDTFSSLDAMLTEMEKTNNLSIGKWCLDMVLKHHDYYQLCAKIAI